MPIEQLKAVCIGTPGVVNPVSRRVSMAPQIPGWERVDLVAELSQWVPCGVLVESELKLSILAEQWKGAGKGIANLVYVNVGVGIGAGILIDGERYQGATGAAGEIGYLPLPDGTAASSADPETFGAFELAAGGIAYARLGRALASGPDGARLRELVGGEIEAIDARTVFQAGADGDPAALALIEELAARLARGIAVVAAVLDPGLVIVGGGVSRAGDLLMAPLQRNLGPLLPRPPKLVMSALGEEGTALGAVMAALQQWETDNHPLLVIGTR